MDNQTPAPAVEQSEPVSQDSVSVSQESQTAAATSVSASASETAGAPDVQGASVVADAPNTPAEHAEQVVEQLREHDGVQAKVENGVPVVIEREVDNVDAVDNVDSGHSSVATPPVVPDHPFQSNPSPLDPLGILCGVKGCPFVEEAHPGSHAEPIVHGLRLNGRFDVKALESRVSALEKEIADLKVIIAHHGLRGPQA